MNGSARFQDEPPSDGGCPPILVLGRLGEDSLTTEATEALESHVEQCTRCQAILQEWVLCDKTLGESKRSTLPREESPPELPGFEIEAEIGRGGMGVVYRAYEPALQRYVALKVVSSGPGAESRVRARWLREARSFSRVRHPNVVGLYGAGEAEGWLYLVLELVPGGTLRQNLETPYHPREAAELVVAISDAVAAIHEAGLLHLDLKPGNILLDARPGVSRELSRPRVSDFGLAHLWNDADASTSSSHTALFRGTPGFIAPESLDGQRKALSPATDVYGMGAILYQAITARPPFVAASVLETLELVRSEDPVAPRKLNPAIARDLETICLKCLRKEPERRYASANELGEDLRRFIEGEAILARRSSPIERSWKWCRRRPVVAALVLVLGITLVAGNLVIAGLWRRSELLRVQEEQNFRLVESSMAALAALIIPSGSTLASLDFSKEPDKKLRNLRVQIQQVLKRQPDHSLFAAYLAKLDAALADLLIGLGKWDEANECVEESIECWNRHLSRHVDDQSARLESLDPKRMRVELSLRRGELASAKRWLELLIEESQAQYERTPDDHWRTSVADMRMRLALLHERSGEPAAALRVTAPTEALLIGSDSGPRSARVAAKIVFNRVYRKSLADSLAESVAAAASAAQTQSSPVDVIADARIADANWAESVWLDLRQALNRASQDLAIEAETGQEFSGLFSESIANDRAMGALEHAEISARKLVAFARLGQSRYPEQVAAYHLAYQAQCQLAKNFMARNDYASTVIALENARGVAAHASTLDPSSKFTQNLVFLTRQKVEYWTGVRDRAWAAGGSKRPPAATPRP